MCVITISVDFKRLLSKGGADLIGLGASWNPAFLHSGFGQFLQTTHLMSLNSLGDVRHTSCGVL